MAQGKYANVNGLDMYYEIHGAGGFFHSRYFNIGYAGWKVSGVKYGGHDE